MALDFVIETPLRRGINRNNNKLIQKRATQAGARTRSKLKSKLQSPLKGIPSVLCPELDDGCHKLAGNCLLANAGFVPEAYSQYVSRFGEGGRLVCTTSPVESVPGLGLSDSSFSVLQVNLFTKLASPSSGATHANRVFKIFNLTQTQILSQLPSSYGQMVFLDHAIECLVARLHEYLPLVKSQARIGGAISLSQLYGRALHSLRIAIENVDDHWLSEIWFATMLLTLAELVSGDDDPGWICHAAGAARLLYKIGPFRIHSEFQVSLLAIQCKSMVVETIVGNKPCFLGDPDWQATLKKTISDNTGRFGVRSRCSVELWCLGAQIPSLFQHVADEMDGRQRRGYRALKVALDKLLNAFAKWKDAWSNELHDVLESRALENAIRIEATMVWFAYLMLLTLAFRLRIALDPWESLHLEIRVREMCETVFKMRRIYAGPSQKVLEQDSVGSQFASGTKKTTRAWCDEILNALPDTPINSTVFHEWCDAIGRQREPFSFNSTYSPDNPP